MLSTTFAEATAVRMWECCQLPMLPVTNWALEIEHWQHWILATFSEALAGEVQTDAVQIAADTVERAP